MTRPLSDAEYGTWLAWHCWPDPISRSQFHLAVELNPAQPIRNAYTLLGALFRHHPVLLSTYPWPEVGEPLCRQVEPATILSSLGRQVPDLVGTGISALHPSAPLSATITNLATRPSLLLRVHHVMIDRLSCQILQADLRNLARRALPNPSPASTNLARPAPFEEFVAWEAAQAVSGPIAIGSIVERYLGCPSTFRISQCRPEPNSEIYARAVNFLLGGDLWEELRKTAAHYQVTVPMILLTAWAWILSCLTGSGEVLVSAPTLGRPAKWLQTVGAFATSKTLRFQLGETERPRDAVQQAKQQVSTMVDGRAPNSGLGLELWRYGYPGTPSTDFTFNYLSFRGRPVAGRAGAATTLAAAYQTGRMTDQCTLEINPVSGRGRFFYPASAFDDSEAYALVSGFLESLRGFKEGSSNLRPIELPSAVLEESRPWSRLEYDRSAPPTTAVERKVLSIANTIHRLPSLGIREPLLATGFTFTDLLRLRDGLLAAGFSCDIAELLRCHNIADIGCALT
jgi:hypothetical protein